MVSAVNLVYLAKVETAYNDGATAFDNGPILLRDASWMPLEADTVERPMVRPWMGNDVRKVRLARGRFQGTVDLSSSGAAGTAPAWKHLMRACGMAETVTASTKVEYKPVSSGFESLASNFFMDDILHHLTGMRGSWSLDMKTGALPELKFDFQGIWNATEISARSGGLDFTPWIDPLPFGADYTQVATLFGANVKLTAFSYTHGNQVAYRDLPGRKEIVIGARSPSASCTIEVPSTLGTDFVALAKAGTTGVFSVQHGAAAGARVTSILNKVQLLPDPKYGAEDGISTLTLNMLPLPTSGDDEITLRIS